MFQPVISLNAMIIQAENHLATFIYMISIVGLIGNTIIFLYFYKKVNPNSTNRAYILSIAVFDIIFIIINFLDTKFVNSLQYNLVCQLNNYCMNSSKNVSAVLLLVLLINNLVRVFEGSYTLGASTCKGQTCSNSSIIFTILTVLALSYYNLWNKSLPVVPNNNNICCGFVQEFNPQFTYKLENGLLAFIYVCAVVLSITLFVFFYLKNFELDCNTRRDPLIEKDMVIGAVFVSLFTSILQIAFFSKLFVELYNSVNKFENLMKNIETSYANTNQSSGNNSKSFEDKEISTDHADIEYMLLMSFSFKFFIYLMTMKSFRNAIFMFLRIKISINPFFIFTDNRSQSTMNEERKLINSSENVLKSSYNNNVNSVGQQNNHPCCSYQINDSKTSIETKSKFDKKSPIKNLSFKKDRSLKLFSIKINNLKGEMV